MLRLHMTKEGHEMTIKLLLAATLALGAQTALAEDALPTLADLEQNAELKASFDKLTKDQDLPEWVLDGMSTSPTQKVSFDGKEYLAMSGCKPHDCGGNQFALLYQPESHDAYGLLALGDPEKKQELTWLNIGGNAESIDGRTLLYAVTTGSIANHADSFAYK